MAGIAMGAAARAESGAPRGPRLLFTNNVRWSMIILVSMDASDTCSPFGKCRRSNSERPSNVRFDGLHGSCGEYVQSNAY